MDLETKLIETDKNWQELKARIPGLIQYISIFWHVAQHSRLLAYISYELYMCTLSQDCETHETVTQYRRILCHVSQIIEIETSQIPNHSKWFAIEVS